MSNNLIHHLKYNNITIIIFLVVFLFAGGVFAQTETGQEFIGSKHTNIEGIDNTLLLEVDLDQYSMDHKIEKIEADEKYYYVTYTFLDINLNKNVWEYQLTEKIRKVSKKIRKDLGEYLAEEMQEEYEARIKELKREKKLALQAGQTTREEVTEYSGLIGQTLELASKVFTDYEPIKRNELPSPGNKTRELFARKEVTTASQSDSLTEIYQEFIQENDPDQDEKYGSSDNCPNDYNPSQLDSDEDGIGDICDPIYNDPEEIDVQDIIDEIDENTEAEINENEGTINEEETGDIEDETEDNTDNTEDENDEESDIEESVDTTDSIIPEPESVEIIELPDTSPTDTSSETTPVPESTPEPTPTPEPEQAPVPTPEPTPAPAPEPTPAPEPAPAPELPGE